MKIYIEEHCHAQIYQTQRLPRGSCSVKVELNYLLCFVTPEPARAWDGAAARARGLVGDHAFQENKLLGAQQAPCSSPRVLEVTRFCHQLGWAGALAGLGHVAFGGAAAGHPGAPAGGELLRWGARPGSAQPPRPPAHTESYWVLTANVAGPGKCRAAKFWNAGLCYFCSQARLFWESSPYTSPAHNCILSAVTLFWGRGRRKGLREWQGRHALRWPQGEYILLPTVLCTVELSSNRFKK